MVVNSGCPSLRSIFRLTATPKFKYLRGNQNLLPFQQVSLYNIYIYINQKSSPLTKSIVYVSQSVIVFYCGLVRPT